MKPKAKAVRSTPVRVPFAQTIMIAAAAVAVIAAIAPRAAHADPGTKPVQSLSEKFPLSRTELATPQGRQAAEARMSAVAARLCREFRDTRTVAHRETYTECVRDAMADARSQVDAAVNYAGGAGTGQAGAGPMPAGERVAGN